MMRPREHGSDEHRGQLRRVLASAAYATGYRQSRIGIAALEVLAAAPRSAGLRVAPFDRSHLDEFRDAGAPDLDQAPSRIGAGDRPWGLWEGSRLVGYGWTSVRPTAFGTEFMITPPTSEPYFYDFYTLPSQRGRGFYPVLLAGIAAALFAEGRDAAWIAVAAGNTSSWRGVTKAGFRECARVHTWGGQIGLLKVRSGAPVPPVLLPAGGPLIVSCGGPPCA